MSKQETAKKSQPAWVKRILKQLEQAKAKDPDFERFGAHSHQYKLSAPASEEAIRAFEERQGIRLPEEYRNFLMLVGNGGAGPYYGLYGLREQEKEIHDSHGSFIYRVQSEPVIYPKMSNEDWDKAADPGGETKRGRGASLCGGSAHRKPGLYPYDGIDAERPVPGTGGLL